MLPSKFRFGVSVFAMSLALSIGAANAAQIVIVDNDTSTGRTVANGDDLRYADGSGNAEPLDFTFDSSVTLGDGVNSISGAEGSLTSTTADTINFILDSGAGVTVVLEDDVIADGVNGGVNPDVINFDLSVGAADTLTIGVNNTDAYNLGGGNIVIRNQNDVVNLNNDISLGLFQFNGQNSTLNIADGVTINGAIDNTIGIAGNVDFAGSGVVSGSIGTTAGVNTIDVNNGGTLELQGAVTNALALNLNGGATLNLTSAGSLVSTNIVTDGADTGTLDVDGLGVIIDGIVGFGGNNLNSITVDTSGSVEFRNDASTSNFTIEGSGQVILNGTNLTLTSTGGIDGANGTITVLSSAEIAADINDVDTLAVDAAATLRFSEDTLDVDTLTLDGGLNFIGGSPVTVSGAINSTGGAAGILDLDQSVTFTDNVGQVQSLASMDVRGGFTVTMQGLSNQIDAVTLDDNGGVGAILLFDQDGTTFTGAIDSAGGEETGVLDINGNTTLGSGFDSGQVNSLGEVQIAATKSLTLNSSLATHDLTLEGDGQLILDAAGIVVTVTNGVQDSNDNGSILVENDATLAGDIGGVGDAISLLDVNAGTLDVTGSTINATTVRVDGGLTFSGANTVVTTEVNSTGGSAGNLTANQNVTFQANVGAAGGTSLATLAVADTRTVILQGLANNIDAITLRGTGGSVLQTVNDGTVITGNIDSDVSELGILDINATTRVNGVIGGTRTLSQVSVADTETFTITGNLRSDTIRLESDSILELGASDIVVTAGTTLDGDQQNGNGTIQLTTGATNSRIDGDIGTVNGIDQITLQTGTDLTFNGLDINVNTIGLTDATSIITFNGTDAQVNVTDITGGGIVNVNDNTSLTGTIGAGAAVSQFNVGTGASFDTNNNVTATNIRLDNATFQTQGQNDITITGDIDSAVAQTDGVFDVDTNTTVAGNIGSNDRLGNIDVASTAALTIGNAVLGATNFTVNGETNYTDSVTLAAGTNANYQDGSTIRLSGTNLATTNGETGNGVYLDADTNNTTVIFSPNANINVEFDVAFRGTVDIIDATGGLLTLNNATFTATNVGALTNAQIDAFANDRVTLTASSKTQEEVVADLGVTQAQAESIITADQIVTAGNDSAGRTALDAAIFNGLSSAAIASKQLSPDMNSMGNTAVSADVGRANFSNISVRLNALRSGRSFINNAYDRTGLATGNNVRMDDNFWVRAFGQIAEQKRRGGVDGYDSSTYGITAGFDTATGVDTRMGLAFGYAITDVDGESAALNSTQINSYQLTLYGDYTPGNFYTEGYVGFALNDVSTKSQLTFGGLSREYRGDYISNQYSTGFEMGYTVPFSGSARIVPYTGLQYYHVTGDTVELRNAGAFDQNVEIDSMSVLDGTLGLRFETEFGYRGGYVIEPSAHMAYVYDFIGDEAEASARYTRGGAVYNVKGFEAEQSAFNFGSGVTYRDGSGLTEWSLAYEGEFKDDYTSHTGVLNATFKF